MLVTATVKIMQGRMKMRNISWLAATATVMALAACATVRSGLGAMPMEHNTLRLRLGPLRWRLPRAAARFLGTSERSARGRRRDSDRATATARPWARRLKAIQGDAKLIP